MARAKAQRLGGAARAGGAPVPSSGGEKRAVARNLRPKVGGDLLDIRECAARLGYKTEGAFRAALYRGGGPPFIRLYRMKGIRFRPTDVDAWIEAKKGEANG